MLAPLGATRHFASLRCLPRDECGTNAGRRPEVGGEPRQTNPGPSAYTNRRAPDGNPRPTCAPTARRWPRTPTTVTPVTLFETYMSRRQAPARHRKPRGPFLRPPQARCIRSRDRATGDRAGRLGRGPRVVPGDAPFPRGPNRRSAVRRGMHRCHGGRGRTPRTRCVERMRRSGRFSMLPARAGTTSSR